MNSRAAWREGTLWAGFALLIVAAIVTVVMPELGERPEEHPDNPATNAPDAGVR